MPFLVIEGSKRMLIEHKMSELTVTFSITCPVFQQTGKLHMMGFLLLVFGVILIGQGLGGLIG